MKNNLIIITIICIIISLVSGCTSSTNTVTTTPTATKVLKATVQPPTITPRPITQSQFDSQFAEDTLPEILTPGKTYKFTLKVFNIGKMPWTFANHTSIFPVTNDSSDTALFNPTRSNLTKKDTIKSGQNYTWTLSITTPTQNGNYSLEFRMINNNTTWFGDTFTKNIIVGQPGDEVTFISKSVTYYQSLVPNSTMSMKTGAWKNVSITANNTGRYSWLGDEMCLAAVDYEPNDALLINQAKNFYFAPDAVIQPGDSSTWKLKFQAPAYPGTYHVEYRLMKDGQWFGNTLNVTVKVT